MAQRFVTLFPELGNMHLTKDVGQIPWFFKHHLGYESALVGFRSDDPFPALEGEARGLDIELIDRGGKQFFIELAVVDYLKKNAPRIDVLNVYHLNRDTFYYGNLYKALNPRGTLYCKLDLANQFLQDGKKRHSANVFKNLIFRRWESRFIRNVDVFSVENSTGLDLMKTRYPACSSKIIYMPNGVNTVFLDDQQQVNFPKEKLVLIMGRIGDITKNHEILLRVIPHLQLKGWKFVFAGPITQRFKPKVEAFYSEFPELREWVIFTGEITDRKTVYDWFRKASITCLTSVSESFGLVYVEGLYFGNYLLGNDRMSSFDDISNQGKFGTKVPFNDDEALRTVFQDLIDNPHKMESVREEMSQFARDNFTWPVLVNRLNHEILKRVQSKS